MSAIYIIRKKTSTYNYENQKPESKTTIT